MYVEDNKSDAAIDEAIKESLADGELNQSKLVKSVKEILPDATRDRIRTRADKLVFDGVVFGRPGKDNAKIYGLSL